MVAERKVSKFRSPALLPDLPRRSTANRKTNPFSPTLQLVRRIVGQWFLRKQYML